MQSQQPVVQQQEPSIQNNHTVLPEKKKNFSWVFFVIFMIFIFLGFGLLFLRNMQIKNNLQRHIIQPLTVSGKDQAKIIDLSPSLPNSQKTAILIELSDSSFQKVILESSLVKGYIKSLPEGDRVISQSVAGQ